MEGSFLTFHPAQLLMLLVEAHLEKIGREVAGRMVDFERSASMPVSDWTER